MRAGWGVLAVFVVVYVPWILARLPEPRGRWRAVALLAFLTTGEAVFLSVLGRRSRKARREWMALAEEWQPAGLPPSNSSGDTDAGREE